MHHFTTEISQLEIGSVVSFLNIAESIYEENMSAYVKIVMRRPFAKIIVRILSHCQLGLTKCIGLLRRDRTTSQNHGTNRDPGQRQL